MSKLSLLAAVSLLLLLLIAGCGGDGGSDSLGSDSLSRAAFIKQGDAICKKAEKEKQVGLEKFLLKSGAGPEKELSNAEQEEMVTTIIVPPIRGAVEGLHDLGVPAEAKARAIVEGVEKIVREAESDPTTMSAATSDPFAKVAKQAGQYGFKTCFLYY